MSEMMNFFVRDLGKYGSAETAFRYRHCWPDWDELSAYVRENPENKELLECVFRMLQENDPRGSEWNEDVHGYEIGCGSFLTEITRDILDEDGNVIDIVKDGYAVV